MTHKIETVNDSLASDYDPVREWNITTTPEHMLILAKRFPELRFSLACSTVIVSGKSTDFLKVSSWYLSEEFLDELLSD